MYEMSKMTLEQEEVRNQEYNEYVEQMTPKHNLWANMGKAFLLGGGTVSYTHLPGASSDQSGTGHSPCLHERYPLYL